jgi:cyclopropane-fatty-acyl-phospholipid synthase
MADRSDLEFTYSLIDEIFRLSLGERADFSGAKFEGDWSLSLEEAQRRKHDYVAEQIGIEPGRRVLDLGCGWGPLLNSIRERGAEGVGVTLSSRPPPAGGRDSMFISATPPRSRAMTSVASTRSPASEPSSTSARRRSTRPAGRRGSTAASSSGSPTCCPQEADCSCRRWSSGAT